MKKGFTLFEMIIVLALIAILSFFAVPAMRDIFLQTKISLQVNQLIRALNFARNLALIKKQPVMLCPRAQNESICGKDWSEGMSIYLMTNSTPILLQQIEAFSGANVTWNRNSQKIVFAYNGLLQSQNGSFIYSLPSKQNSIRHVILSSTGRVRTA